MRILTLCYEYPPIGGGGASVARGLASTLTRRGHAVDVVTMGFRDLPKEEVVEGVRIHRVPCGREKESKCTVREAAVYVRAARPLVRRLLRDENFDIVHVHFIFPDGVLAWCEVVPAGVPYVITAHGTDVPGYNQKSLFRIVHPLLKGLWHRVIAGAGEIVSPSDTLAELIEKARPGTLVDVIPNAIDVDRFRPMAKKPQILVATRFVERKGVQHVLKAMQGLETGFDLVIAGGGEYGARLLELNEVLGRPARFVGWMDNQSEEYLKLLSESAIYALPSDFENFPMSILEAMSVGSAVITTRGHGCEEAIGDTGILVTPGNVDAAACVREIRAALVRLTSDPGRAYLELLGARARRRVEENFAWPSVAARYEDLYGRHLRHRPH